MPRHPEDPGLDFLHADPACPTCGRDEHNTAATEVARPATQDPSRPECLFKVCASPDACSVECQCPAGHPLRQELDDAVTRADLEKDEL